MLCCCYLKHNGEDISLNITVKLEPVLLNSCVKFLRHPLFLSNTRLCEESQYIRNLQPVFPCESPDIIETPLWVVIPGAVKLA